MKRAHADGEDRQPRRLTERDVGLLEYLNGDWAPVQGIIKQRYSDFLVHELAPDGSVVHLASLAPPSGQCATRWAHEVEKVPDTSEASAPAETPVAPAEPPAAPPAADYTPLAPYFDADAIASLASLTRDACVVSRRLDDKAARTQVHQLIRTLSGGSLISEALTVDGAPAISVRRASGRRAGRDARPDPTSEAHSAPPYIHFALQKTNRDSQEALQWLARSLRLGGPRGGASATNLLSVAGTKDRRAVTVQRVALRRGKKTLEDVWRMANHIDLPIAARDGPRRSVLYAATTRAERGLRVADLRYAAEPLQLGDLAGNQFTITLRDVRWVDGAGDLGAELARRVAAVASTGYINYFGAHTLTRHAALRHRRSPDARCRYRGPARRLCRRARAAPRAARGRRQRVDCARGQSRVRRAALRRRAASLPALVRRRARGAREDDGARLAHGGRARRVPERAYMLTDPTHAAPHVRARVPVVPVEQARLGAHPPLRRAPRRGRHAQRRHRARRRGRGARRHC